MGKGEGKGEGKGKRHHYHSHGNNGNCNICGCLCVMIILPPFFLIIGGILFFSENTRVERIVKYNELIDNWINYDYFAFQNKDFSLVYNTQKYSFDHKDDKSGTSWPVRDRCSSDGDPDGGCKTANGYMYRIPSVSFQPTSLVIYQNSSILINDYPSQYKYVYYSRSQLNCDDDDDDYYCKVYCKSRDGTWTGSQCQVKKYLTNVCYRLRASGNSFETDKPAQYLQKSTSSIGCYYNDNYFSPYIYGSSTSQSYFTVELRLNTDPVVLASDLTFGCSDTCSYANNCFGMSQGEQASIGGILFGVGALLIIVEAGIITAMCLCCKDTLKSRMSRYREPLIAATYTTPAAVPVTIPLAQQAYTTTTTTTSIPVATYSQPMYSNTQSIPQAAYASPTQNMAIPVSYQPNATQQPSATQQPNIAQPVNPMYPNNTYPIQPVQQNYYSNNNMPKASIV